MLHRNLIIIMSMFLITACGLLAPTGEVAEGVFMGPPDKQSIDPQAAARAAAAMQMIERGVTSDNPAEAQHWINLGVDLLK